MSLTIVTAGEIKVGDQIPEQDGFLFEVIQVAPKGKTMVDITMASDFSSIPKHHKCNGGVTQSFRKTTQLYIAA